MIKTAGFLDEVECPVCKKLFVKAPENIYKVTINKSVWHCCSWTCYNKALDIRSGGTSKRKYETVK